MPAEQNFTLWKKDCFNTETEPVVKRPKHKTRSFTRSKVSSARVPLRGAVLKRY